MADNVVKRVSTIFTIKDDDFNKSLTNMNKQMKLTQSELKLAGERVKAFGGNTDDLKLKQQALTQQIQNSKDKISLYNKSIEDSSKRLDKNQSELVELGKTKDDINKKYKDAVKAYGEESEEARRLKDELDKTKEAYKEKDNVIKSNINTLNNHQTNMKNTEAELVKLQGELKKTSDEIDKNNNKWLNAGENLQKAGDKISKAGDKISKVGKTLTIGVTAPIVAAGTLAAKSAIEFESAFAGVKKTVNGTEEQLKQLEEGIIGMSKTLPTSASDIAHVGEAAGQLGIQTENILSFTKTIIDLGNATNLVGEEGASSLAKFANITQMSQKDFDRLGSTIVALGNNSATTEADIVAMGMRLAGAGTQVGLTEAQIMGLSAALSSVGIEAEAGGSAISKVMVDMQLAVEKGGDSLDEFAKVAGISASQFKKAYKEDASGALIEFIKGLSESEKKGVSAIKVLDDMGITEVRMRDALLRAAGAGDLFNKSIQLGTDAWKENTALVNEANQRYATTESQLAITKNQIMDAAIKIGNNLLPAVRDIAVSIAGVTEKFSKLSPETQQNIIKFGLFAAAIGPVTSVVGGLTKGVGGTISTIGKLAKTLGTATTATSAVGTAAGVAGGAGGIGALVGGLGSAVVAAAPFVIGAGAIAAAGYGVYKVMSSDVVPSVDLFADKLEVVGTKMVGHNEVLQTETIKISEATKKQVQSYLDLDQGATQALNNLYINSTIITDQTCTELTMKYQQMGQTITTSLNQDKVNNIASLQDFFNQSKAISTAEEAEILAQTDSYYKNKEGIVRQYESQITAIIDNAKNEHRQITEEEKQIINDLQQKMKEEAVKTLSENEKEAQIILGRMKSYDTRTTAEQTAEHIRLLNESRDKAVKSTNEEFVNRKALIEQLRDEAKVITADQADAMIKEAERQRDGIVKKADETRLGAIEKMREMNVDLDKQVNTSTGEILNTWDKIKRWWSGWIPESKLFTYTVSARQEQSSSGIDIPQNALGTNYFQGGLTYMHEKKYELYEHPRGSKIYNHEASERYVERATEKLVDRLLNSFKGGDPTIIINSIAPLSPSETARQTKRALQEFALGM